DKIPPTVGRSILRREKHGRHDALPPGLRRMGPERLPFPRHRSGKPENAERSFTPMLTPVRIAACRAAIDAAACTRAARRKLHALIPVNARLFVACSQPVGSTEPQQTAFLHEPI